MVGRGRPVGGQGRQPPQLPSLFQHPCVAMEGWVDSCCFHFSLIYCNFEEPMQLEYLLAFVYPPACPSCRCHLLYIFSILEIGMCRSFTPSFCRSSNDFMAAISDGYTVNPDKLKQLTLNVGMVLLQCKSSKFIWTGPNQNGSSLNRFAWLTCIATGLKIC